MTTTETDGLHHLIGALTSVHSAQRRISGDRCVSVSSTYHPSGIISVCLQVEPMSRAIDIAAELHLTEGAAATAGVRAWRGTLGAMQITLLGTED